MPEQKTINGGFVKWSVFKWVIGGIATLLILMWAFIGSLSVTAQDNRVDNATTYTLVETSLKSIDKEITEIKEILETLRD